MNNRSMFLLAALTMVAALSAAVIVDFKIKQWKLMAQKLYIFLGSWKTRAREDEINAREYYEWSQYEPETKIKGINFTDKWLIHVFC